MRTPSRCTRASPAWMAALGLLALLAGAAPAAAAPTCTFDAPTGTITVQLGDGESAVIGRSGDAITLDGVPCDVATVVNTDTVAVNATGIALEIAIDLSGGPFAPGLSPEAEGEPEIEFAVNVGAGNPTLRITGGAGPDNVIVGVGGINLNGTESVGDADVTTTGSPSIVVEGAGGGDVLSVAGGSGTGAPATGVALRGGDDGDLFLGAAGGNALDGEAGPDTLDYSGATQVLLADLGQGFVALPGGSDQIAGIESLTGSPGDDQLVGDDGPNVLRGGDGDDHIAGGEGDDQLVGGAGRDTVSYAGASQGVTLNLIGQGFASGQGTDTVSQFEDAIGSPFDDVIVGNADDNTIDGGDGDDLVDGASGNDTLIGGPGSDTVSYANAANGVTVDLRDGTAEGAGDDTLSGFENVSGSSRGDTIHGDSRPNVISGRRGADRIFGGDGPDTIVGGDGRDDLFGHAGNDLLKGGRGKDELDGGKGNDDVCRGGPDPDSFLACENYPPRR